MSFDGFKFIHSNQISQAGHSRGTALPLVWETVSEIISDGKHERRTVIDDICPSVWYLVLAVGP
jgi:hypothetical protein